MCTLFTQIFLHLLLLNQAWEHVVAVHTEASNQRNDSSEKPMYPAITIIGGYKKSGISIHDEFSPPDELRFPPRETIASSVPEMKTNERKLQMCPLPRSRQDLVSVLQENPTLATCLFETNGEVSCEEQPKPHLIEDEAAKQTWFCKPGSSKKIYVFGALLCFTYTEKNGIATYNKGIQGFIENMNKEYNVLRNGLRLYDICYNTMTNKTEATMYWIQSTSKPPRQYGSKVELSTEDFGIKRNRFVKIREAFESQNLNSSDAMVPQPMVPVAVESYPLWELATSHYVNVKPLWKSLVSLVNLIHECLSLSFLQYGQIKHSLPVATRAFYFKWEYAEKKYLNNEVLIPNVWSITAYHSWTKFGIIVLVHNTPEQPPKPNELCRDPAPCDFQKCRSGPVSQSLKDVTDQQTRYAYCCRTVDFPDHPEIEQVMQMDNFEQ